MRTACLVFASLLWCTSITEAQHRLPVRRVGVMWQNGTPRINVSVRDLANTPSVRRSLTSGIARRMNVSVQTFRSGSARPVASRSFACTITYDIFERSFVVRRGRRSAVASDYDDVLERCLTLRRHRAGTAAEFAGLEGQTIFFAVRAEFNPIDRRRCRQLLRGSGSSQQDPIGPIVINIVRREICEAERVVEFRSQDIVVPASNGGSR